MAAENLNPIAIGIMQTTALMLPVALIIMSFYIQEMIEPRVESVAPVFKTFLVLLGLLGIAGLTATLGLFDFLEGLVIIAAVAMSGAFLAFARMVYQLYKRTGDEIRRAWLTLEL